MPIVRVEKDESDPAVRYVYGKATDDTLDSDEQIVDGKFAKTAMAEWFESAGNVRQMHSTNIPPAGRGVLLESKPDGEYVKVKVVEPGAVRLVDEGVYRGYSVGIARPRIVHDNKARGGRINAGRIVELSLVDRPANYSALFQVAKAASDGSMEYVGKVVALGAPPTVRPAGPKALNARRVQVGRHVTARYRTGDDTATIEGVVVAKSPTGLAIDSTGYAPAGAALRLFWDDVDAVYPGSIAKYSDGQSRDGSGRWSLPGGYSTEPGEGAMAGLDVHHDHGNGVSEYVGSVDEGPFTGRPGERSFASRPALGRGDIHRTPQAAMDHLVRAHEKDHAATKYDSHETPTYIDGPKAAVPDTTKDEGRDEGGRWSSSGSDRSGSDERGAGRASATGRAHASDQGLAHGRGLGGGKPHPTPPERGHGDAGPHDDQHSTTEESVEDDKRPAAEDEGSGDRPGLPAEASDRARSATTKRKARKAAAKAAAPEAKAHTVDGCDGDFVDGKCNKCGGGAKAAKGADIASAEEDLQQVTEDLEQVADDLGEATGIDADDADDEDDSKDDGDGDGDKVAKSAAKKVARAAKREARKAAKAEKKAAKAEKNAGDAPTFLDVVSGTAPVAAKADAPVGDDLARAHDALCPAYGRKALAKAGGADHARARDIILDAIRRETDGAAVEHLGKAYRALSDAIAAEAASGKAAKLALAAQDDLHGAFKGANPGAPKLVPPKPSETVSPGEFNRGYIGAGHQREDGASGGGSARIPTTTHPISADDFRRGPLGDGHQRYFAGKLAEAHDAIAAWRPDLCRMRAFDPAEGNFGTERQPGPAALAIPIPNGQANGLTTVAPVAYKVVGGTATATVPNTATWFYAPPLDTTATQRPDLDAAVAKAMEPTFAKIASLEAEVSRLAAEPDPARSAPKGVTGPVRPAKVEKAAGADDRAQRRAARRTAKVENLRAWASGPDPERRIWASERLARLGEGLEAE